MYKTTFRFSIWQRVKIKALDAEGIVFALNEKPGRTRSYDVRYWIDGQRKEDWLEEMELHEIGDKHDILIKPHLASEEFLKERDSCVNVDILFERDQEENGE